MNPALTGLYAITDEHLLPTTEILLARAEDALRGGAQVVQYRDKSEDQSKRLAQALALNQLCRRYQRPLLINDDVELALNCGAAGVHLGQKDGSIAAARKILGADAIIGATCHNQLSLAKQAVAEGASYVAFGAFFPSATKPGATPADRQILQQARSQLAVPVVAIGGITRDNAQLVINSGAQMIAVIGSLFDGDDTQARARAFSDLFID